MRQSKSIVVVSDLNKSLLSYRSHFFIKGKVLSNFILIDENADLNVNLIAIIFKLNGKMIKHSSTLTKSIDLKTS